VRSWWTSGSSERRGEEERGEEPPALGREGVPRGLSLSLSLSRSLSLSLAFPESFGEPSLFSFSKEENMDFGYVVPFWKYSKRPLGDASSSFASTREVQFMQPAAVPTMVRTLSCVTSEPMSFPSITRDTELSSAMALIVAPPRPRITPLNWAGMATFPSTSTLFVPSEETIRE
jgi:hypothetical protein